ncbi:hypothetical protein psyc5s11_29030 [Clostridium gelidum]|uniref:Anti-bacteriophage protein A/HamA C-terminal domain-containing protein n=1 Tax=Clostridium gelidum TaxID=704125 RepID=A0ABN6IXH0_9CLOT|nr:hypothetical protein [Clostridium gelidum]BCZ46836.1 hypothetical protein psyc5s11_29030 [Clostridium gelidum]
MSNFNYIMEPNEFFEEVINLYEISRRTKYPNDLIRRGTSHSISSEIEDLMAQFLVTNLKNKYKIYIAQTLSYKINNKSKSCEFDLLLVDNKNEINNVVEIKIDQGHIRNGVVNYCKNRRYLLDMLERNLCKCNDGITKEKFTLKFGDKPTCHLVIVSNKNISKRELDENIKKIKCISNIELYFLSNGEHPNSYKFKGTELIDKISIDKDEFGRLMDSLSY